MSKFHPPQSYSRTPEEMLKIVSDWEKRHFADSNSTPFAEVPPARSEKLFLSLDATTEAVVEITIKTRGLGAIDPQNRRAPTARELHEVAGLLTRRVYQFHPSAD